MLEEKKDEMIKTEQKEPKFPKQIVTWDRDILF